MRLFFLLGDEESKLTSALLGKVWVRKVEIWLNQTAMTRSWIQTGLWFYAQHRKKKTKIRSTRPATNIWRKGLLFCPSVPVSLQIYGCILVLAPPPGLEHLFIRWLPWRCDAGWPGLQPLSPPLCRNFTTRPHKINPCVCLCVLVFLLFKTHPAVASCCSLRSLTWFGRWIHTFWGDFHCTLGQHGPESPE